MSEISNSNREAERQRIEQMEREQRKTEEARIMQERENSKALQEESFSPSVNEPDVKPTQESERQIVDYGLTLDNDSDKMDSTSDALQFEEFQPKLEDIGYGLYTKEQNETHKGLEKIAKEYANKELSDEDKKELSDRQYDYLKDRRPEERDDARIPTPESIKTVTEGPDGRCEIEKNWRDGTDGCERGSREMALIKAGTTIDRIGSCEGKYCSPLNENGSPYSIKERATGDRMVESPIENNSSYHRYEVKQDLTRENISAAIDKHYSGEEQEKMHEKLDKYFQDCCNSKSHDHRGDIYSEKTANEVDGIKTGKIDHMFEKDDGGGRQFIMPFSVSQMEDMGLIEEKE